jgi:hypothetical protein
VAIFDDIDISIVIERKIQGKKVPLPYVIEKQMKKVFLIFVAKLEMDRSSRLKMKVIIY